MGILSEITEELNNLFTDNPDLVATIPRKYVDSITTDAYGVDHDVYVETTTELIPLDLNQKQIIEMFGDNFESSLIFFTKTTILTDDVITWDGDDYVISEIKSIPIGTTVVGSFFGVTKQL